MSRFTLLTALLTLTAACSSSTSTVGQLITCETDPETGVVTRCEPADGSGGDGAGCTDVDEDGDGTPSDDGPLMRTTPGGDGDGDGDGDDGDGDCDDDGVPDVDDCDEQPGGDDDDADLPYNFDMRLGETYRPIADAFAEKGGEPEIVSIIPEEGDTVWRIDELRAGTPMTLTQADCDHVGNKAVGEDRIVITWRTADGGTESDHMTLRYCND